MSDDQADQATRAVDYAKRFLRDAAAKAAAASKRVPVRAAPVLPSEAKPKVKSPPSDGGVT